MDAFDLTGRTAVVTGGSRGIGRAIALGLAEAGADVAPVARRLDDVAATAAALRERTPVDRFADPVEVAGPAVFLASDAAAYVTGTVLTVDGGWTAR